jgi:O-antigen ligase
MVLSDYPLGVGANTYVTIANAGGYMERAGVTWGGQSRTTYVHNAYWATAAETGYFGVLAFAFLILRITFAAFHCGWRARNDPRGDLLLGLGVCLLVVALHNFYEWIFFLFTIQYLFAIVAGLVASLTLELNYGRSRTPAIGVRLDVRTPEKRPS